MAARVIALATLKGGSGKSTTAVCLAAHWWRAGQAVALLDTDPQRSVSRWRQSGDDLAAVLLVTADDPDVDAAIDDLAGKGIARIVVDTPGFRAPVSEAVLARADLALIPLKASPVDFEIAADTVDMIEAINRGRRSQGRPLAHRFLLTQIVRESVIARHMRAELRRVGYNLLESELAARVIYAEAALAGSAPSVLEPEGPAAREIAALSGELDRLMNGQSRVGGGRG